MSEAVAAVARAPRESAVAEPAAPMVAVRRVSKTYRGLAGDILALASVDLDVARGEFVSLLGPSGCGKTTLLRMIAGLETPSTGGIEVYGRSRDDLGFVFQRDVLLDWRTILDNVLLPVEFKRERRRAYKDRARELLDLFGLGGYEDRHPWELSGGMRQRAAICRALILEPQLLLMDEPFGALDAITRDGLNVELQALWQRTGTTVIFVTHSISEAVFLSDRIVVVSGRPGRMVEDVRIEFARPRTLDVREEPGFGRHSRHLRDVLDRHGAATRS